MSIFDKKISRKDFVKGTALTAAGIMMASPVNALASGMTFKDNVKTEVVISPSQPADKGSLWVDTGAGGVIKYYNGITWETTRAVWG